MTGAKANQQENRVGRVHIEVFRDKYRLRWTPPYS